jgi:SAM-dependent methyltransferase
LDVACGPGYVAEAAAGQGLSVTGLDFAPAMLALARQRVPGGDFREGDAENLPFDEGSFDAVACAFGHLHFGDPDRAMAEACRVLKPGGRYAFSVWQVPPPGSFMALVGGAIRKHGNPKAGAPPGPDFFRFADPDNSTAALRAAGFDEIERLEAPITITVEVDEIIKTVYAIGVRTLAILEAQSDEAREEIHAASGSVLIGTAPGLCRSRQWILGSAPARARRATGGPRSRPEIDSRRLESLASAGPRKRLAAEAGNHDGTP